MRQKLTKRNQRKTQKRSKNNIQKVRSA